MAIQVSDWQAQGYVRVDRKMGEIKRQLTLKSGPSLNVERVDSFLQWIIDGESDNFLRMHTGRPRIYTITVDSSLTVQQLMKISGIQVGYQQEIIEYPRTSYPTDEQDAEWHQIVLLPFGLLHGIMKREEAWGELAKHDLLPSPLIHLLTFCVNHSSAHKLLEERPLFALGNWHVDNRDTRHFPLIFNKTLYPDSWSEQIGHNALYAFTIRKYQSDRNICAA